MMRRAFAALLVLGGLTVGCAGDKDTLDLVQPNYVAKEDLIGKSWYYRRTVVDSPETMYPYAGVGSGDLFTIERIKFEVQEDWLVAYRDYEYVGGSEDEQLPGTGDNYLGTPVATFAIESHFDIIKDYNPATGEETNVRREDSSEREWHNREFIRVAWNQGVFLSDYYLLPVDFLENDGGMPGTHDFVHPDDAVNPYRARLTPEKGYIDIVLNHTVVPDLAVCYYEFDFGLYDLSNACASGETRVRHAFMEVDELQNETYEPLYFPDSVVLTDDQGHELPDPETGGVQREGIFERFGYYRLERLTYDRERDLTETGRLYRAIRFNIWKASRNAAGETIPYADRKVRPIVYHLNWDFPQELEATAQEVADGWNDAFKETVAALQGEAIDQVDDVFVLRTNSCNFANVEGYLNRNDLMEQARELVGASMTTPEMCDADYPNSSVLCSLGKPTLDNYCSVAEYLSDGDFSWQQIGDPRFNMMYWINHRPPSGWSGYGPMLGDPMTGLNVTATAYVMGWTIDAAAMRAMEYVDYINGELELFDLLRGENLPNTFFAGDYDPLAQTHSIDSVRSAAAEEPSDAYMADLKARFASQGDSWDELMTPLDNSAHFAERLGRVAGTDIERDYLLRPEDLRLASRGAWQPGDAVSDDLMFQASIINRVRERMGKQEETSRFLQERTMCPIAELDDALIGLAASLKDLTRDERLLELRKYYFRAVMLHEVGHNVGLRHNFEASYDALNYDPTFWQIEESLGADDQAKLEAKQPEFMYSSIMDYHGKVNGDFHGLGKYDHAAIKFGYGQLLEKFVDSTTFSDANIKGGDAMRDWRFFNDYKKIPALVGSVADMDAREDFMFDWTDPANLVAATTAGMLEREVPYMFCSDEYANRTPFCKRFDFGANQREVQKANYVGYKNYFIFSNFLRNRLVLDFSRVAGRSDKVFADSLLTYQYMYLYKAKYDQFLDTDLGRDMAKAVGDGLNVMSEVIAMPRPTTYFKCAVDLGQPTEGDVMYYSSGYLDYDPVIDPTTAVGPDGETCDMGNGSAVGLGEGFPLFLGFSEEYINYTFTYLGTYWDKLNALFWMNLPVANYYRENLEEDRRRYSVSFYRLYNQEVNDVLQGLIEFEPKSVASGFDALTGKILPREMVDFNGAPDARIVPALARNLQYYSLMYGMAFLTSPLDDTLDFGKHLRVVLKGAPDDYFDSAGFAPEPITGCPDGQRCYVECTLPEAGQTYRAHNTTAASSQIDIAYNFVKRCANDAVVRAGAVTDLGLAEGAHVVVDGELQALEVQLAALTTGTPEYTAKEAEITAKGDELNASYETVGLAQDAFDLADAQLRQGEQVLVYIRQLNRVYEYGSGL